MIEFFFLQFFSDNSHHCYDCNLNFELSTMLLMHNLDVHRKTGIARRKISSFLSNILENEMLYSSDSECEYRITTTVCRIAKINPDIKAKNDSDDDSSNRMTRSVSIANVKGEASEVDRGDDRINCHICGFVVVTEQILREHIKTKHGVGDANENGNDISLEFNEENNDNPTSGTNDQSKKRVRSRRFSCDVCSKFFKQKAALVKHMKQHSRIEDGGEEDDGNNTSDDISDNYDTDDSDAVNSKTKSTSGVPCNLCGKIYERKDHMLKHFKTFHPQNEDALGIVLDVINKHEGIGFPCTSCPTVYPNRDSLRRHLRRTHGIHRDNKTNQCLTCDECGKVFYRPKCFATHLKKHRETIVEKRRTKSPKKKTHLCSFCGKSYPGSNHLKIHLRIHTGKTMVTLNCVKIKLEFFYLNRRTSI